MRIEEQDLRLLKALVSNNSLSSEFVNCYDADLFLGDAKPFAKAAIDYIKAYKALPTKRVMVENASNNQDLANQFYEIWDAIEAVDFDPSEFRYDLEKIKNRFTEQKIHSIRDIIDTDLGGDSDYDKRIRT